jgi:hypothetical protein
MLLHYERRDFWRHNCDGACHNRYAVSNGEDLQFPEGRDISVGRRRSSLDSGL